jgi:hypothetical protein
VTGRVAPWPVVNECHSQHVPGHTCPQCDGSHEHRWIAWHAAPEVVSGITEAGPLYAAPGVPVRCANCGTRNCDLSDCLLRRHHRGPHESF